MKIFIPAFFLFSGYIYESSLLNLFSINISNYFSISDYISSSFNQIFITIFSILLGFFSGAFFQTKILQYRDSSGKKMIFSMIFLILPMTLLSIMITSFFIYYELPFSFLGCAVILFFIAYFLGFVPFETIIFFFFCLIYVFLISKSAVDQYNTIVDHRPNYIIKFKKDSRLLNGAYSIVTSNSKYYFFYDNKLHKVIIVPVENVNSVSKNIHKIKSFQSEIIEMLRLSKTSVIHDTGT